MTDVVAPTGSRLTAVLRGDDERVTPLELFFDLVFVLAITQCTALMAHEKRDRDHRAARRPRRAAAVSRMW